MQFLYQFHDLKTSTSIIQPYLVFGNLLWIEINVFFGKEFISDFCDICFLLQVKFKFMHIFPWLRCQLIDNC